MKKLVFAFMAMAAMTFMSCGNATSKSANDADSVAMTDTVDTLAVDSVVVDSAVVE